VLIHIRGREDEALPPTAGVRLAGYARSVVRVLLLGCVVIALTEIDLPAFHVAGYVYGVLLVIGVLGPWAVWAVRGVRRRRPRA
jgi:hypothetical protein